MSSQAAQAGTVIMTAKSIRSSRAIQNGKVFLRLLGSPTLIMLVLSILLVPWLLLATKASVVIPCSRRGGRYL